MQKHIEDEFAKTRARSIITIDKTLKELAYVMNSDITDFLEDQGVGYFIFKNFAELPPEMTKAIQSFEQTITQTGEVKIKIRLHPKMDAIKTAAQHLGILMDHLKLTVDSDKPLIDARQQVVQIGFPRMDLSIEEWEAMCEEADRAREAIMLQQGDVEVRDKEESDDEE